MGATQEGRVFHVLRVPAVGFGYPAFSSPGRQWFVASGHNVMTLCHASSASWFVGNKTWVLPHPCPSSAPRLLMGTNYEGGSCSAAI